MTKKCKHCKEEFKPYRFNQKYCFKKECTRVFLDEIEANKKKAWNKEKKKRLEKLKTLKDYLNECQVVFNKYIRLRDQNKGCISCGASLVGIKFDAGHYYSVGSSPSIRFNEDNVHGQCVHCNRHLHGNLIEYTYRLPDRITQEKIEELSKLKNELKKYTIPEVKDLIEKYKKKIKEYEQ
jgi:hypothetical protein